LPSLTQPARRKVSIERTVNAAIDDVWDLWTTKEGIESWWGPEGFVAKVRKLDFRPGGELAYTMIATAPEQIEFLKKAGMPGDERASADLYGGGSAAATCLHTPGRLYPRRQDGLDVRWDAR
jgi:hypothetical protein